jgi:hypothetical protein
MPLATEDQLAIMQLMARYNHLVDAGDGEGWADLWIDDGRLDTGMGMVIEGGRSALVDYASGVPALVPGARHMMTNVLVDGEGDEATASCYLQMWATGADVAETRLVMSGVYSDVLRRTDAGWRFVTRVVSADRGQALGD